MSQAERRSAPRHPLVITMELSVGHTLSLHACANLSSGGAYFEQAIPFEVGTTVDVSFGIPGEADLLRCKGEVVSVPQPGAYGMAVKFLDLSEGEKGRIDAFAEQATTPERA